METPRSPTSPISPTSAHPLEGGFSPRQPQLQVVTTFPLNSVLGRRPSLSLTTVPIVNSLSSPPTPTPGFRAHRSHRRTSSNITFPSPIEAILMQPLSSLPTPPSPHARMAIDALLNPLSVREIDGRQSRMAMRSPVPQSASVFSPMSLCTPTPMTAIRSPILEQVVALPLRVNTSAQTPTTPMEMDSYIATFSAATTAVSSRPESRSGSRANSRTRWGTTHTRGSAMTHPPNDVLTGTRERSPIRKPLTHRRRRSPAPTYHVSVQPSLASTLNGPPSLPPMSPRTLREYSSAINHLSTPLVPLISVTNGLPHPQFPRSLLQYHLLTHEQLDTLARWYHQTEPASEEAFMYPAWIPPYAAARRSPTAGPEYRPSSQFADMSLTTKRRRWGRFIGLRGCESPITQQFPDGAGGVRSREEEEEGLVERMEREWRNAIQRARDEEMMREKGWRGRW